MAEDRDLTAASTEGIGAVLLRLTEVLERLTESQAGGRAAVGVKAGERLPVWLTVTEAAEWCGFSIDFLYDRFNAGELHICGVPHRFRILRSHLDEQVARGFPRLDLKSTTDLVAEALARANQPSEALMPAVRKANPAGQSGPLRLALPKAKA